MKLIPTRSQHSRQTCGARLTHRGLPLALALVATLALSALGTGCKQSKPAAKKSALTPTTAAVTTDVSTPPDAGPPKKADATATPDAPTADASTADASTLVADVASDNAASAVPTPPAKPYDRKTLEAAYIEISCIQKKGEAAKLLAAYKKYGFADPRAWIRAWESQKKTPDYEQWLAALTQKAWKACP